MKLATKHTLELSEEEFYILRNLLDIVPVACEDGKGNNTKEWKFIAEFFYMLRERAAQ